MSRPEPSGLVLSSEFGALRLTLDAGTGLPLSLGTFEAGDLGLGAEFTLLLGGGEARGAVGDLVYPGAETVGDPRVTGPITDHLLRGGRQFVVPMAIADWTGEFRYTFRATEPGLTWSWLLRPGADALPLRNLVVALSLDLEQTDWVVEAPGNRLRAHLPVADLSEAGTIINSIGGALGSAGIVALERVDAARTVLLWPRSLDETGVSVLRRTPTGIRLEHTMNVAAGAEPGTELVIDGIALDVVEEGWSTVAERVPLWYDSLGLSTPRSRPHWTRSATIFEAQIGTSIFAGGTWTYSPYPEVADLLADLPRIHDLGFDTIQIMPRQPFPSYNVIDYDDVARTWGDEEDLRRVIAWCHARGMRVILDILLHGVLDRESIGEAADAVRSGPWAQYCGASQEELDELALSVADTNQLTWSRHILDFEDAWASGSPERHPLTLEHPEWFCTDSSGRIVGVYTKAFDMSNPEWQDYFIAAAVGLVRRLGIDGFRFDAPGYNNFPNWSPRTRSRASLQQLGATGLFRRLRPALRAVDPEVMLYTEENGPLWRQDMDLNYNYDEYWLPDSLFGSGSEHPPSRVRHGRDLAEWIGERDRSLPVDSVTAHHVDSHDSFWFHLPGRKWRREQFGLDATRALMCAYALSGGPFMMFVGGEEGMTDHVRRVNELRAARPELIDGRTLHGWPVAERPELYTAHVTTLEESAILAVNLSDHELLTRLLDQTGTVLDLLDGTEFDLGEPIAWAPFQARYLVRQP